MCTQNKIINKITPIMESHNFEYLDEGVGEVKYEYTGDDILYFDINDFSDKFKFDEFSNFMGDIVASHLESFIDEVKNIVPCNVIYDESDYVCIYLEFRKFLGIGEKGYRLWNKPISSATYRWDTI